MTATIYTNTPKKPPKKPRAFKQLERAPADQAPPVRLTDRDKAIIEAVYIHRALTAEQIETLLFPSDPNLKYGKKTWCQNRLKLLFHNGYLFRDDQPRKRNEPLKPLVYFLDHEGAVVLCEALGLEPEEIEWQPQDNLISDLKHLLDTNQVRVAIEAGVGYKAATGYRLETNNQVELVRWIDDKTLKKTEHKDSVILVGPQGGKLKVSIVPDGYCHLQVWGYDFHHLLEADRGTVTGEASQWGRRDWARKIKAYLAYYETGIYQKRYNTTSLRVLTVTTTPRRLATLKRITEEAGGKGRFWFTTYDQVNPQTVLFAPIWQRAASDELYTLLRPPDNSPSSQK